VWIEQELHLDGGEWKPSAMQLRRPGGLPTALALDPQVAGFLRNCDGTRTLNELGERLADEVKVDAGQVRQQCCAVVRKLVERRLVLL
jgi:hypothetical protein